MADTWFAPYESAERENVIGGTDLAAIIGFSKYSSPIDVWRDKRGLSLPWVDNQHTLWGRKLESVVADHYAETEGVELYSPEANGTPCLHMPAQETAHHGGSADRLLIGQRKGLEVKTAFMGSEDWGMDGTDCVPLAYLIQSAWYMHVFDCETWDLAALIGGHDYRKYTLARNVDLESMLIDAADRFWRENVQADIPPAVDASASYGRYLADKYKDHGQDMLVANPEADDLLSRLKIEKIKLKKHGDAADLLTNLLKERIGSNVGIIGVAGKATWKTNKNGVRTFRATFSDKE